MTGGSEKDRSLVIILNGVSRKKDFFYEHILPTLSAHFPVEVFETQRANHAISLAAIAGEKRPYAILAAGGDGTLNQTINGMLASEETGRPLPHLGIIPLGTGNDFARMCRITSDPQTITKQLQQEPLPTDVGRISCQDENGNPIERYFINACSVGMGPAVVKRLESSDRSLGPSLTYIKAILQTFFTHRPEEISVRSQNWEWQGRMRVLAIANGQSFGNAIYIAPDAHPGDGILSTFIAGDVSLPRFLYFLQKIKSPQKITDPKAWYNNTRRLEITSPAPCRIESEGELAGFLPAIIEVVPKRINFIRSVP